MPSYWKLSNMKAGSSYCTACFGFESKVNTCKLKFKLCSLVKFNWNHLSRKQPDLDTTSMFTVPAFLTQWSASFCNCCHVKAFPLSNDFFIFSSGKEEKMFYCLSIIWCHVSHKMNLHNVLIRTKENNTTDFAAKTGFVLTNFVHKSISHNRP